MQQYYSASLKEKSKYFSVTSVGNKHSKIWLFSQQNLRLSFQVPLDQTEKTLILYIPVQFVHVRCGDTFISSPSCNLTEGVWSRKWRMISFVF